MYRKEVNECSPLRIFERSIHGGLGRGNLGVIISRAGVGKTAFLVDIALDDLMRRRKVLHVSINDSVDRVRSFYDEMFIELAKATRLENVDEVRLSMERNRHIHSYKDVSFSVDRLVTVVRFLKEHADFPVDALMIDNFPFGSCTEEEMDAVRKLAGEMDCEVWFTALCHREDTTDAQGYPDPVGDLDSYVSVKIYLEPSDKSTRLRLLKDHDNDSPGEVMLDLDPTTLLVRDRQGTETA
jgi:hypothetical protein